jgi:hypothetical protein
VAPIDDDSFRWAVFDPPLNPTVTSRSYAHADITTNDLYALNHLGKYLEFGQYAVRNITLAAACYSASAKRDNSSGHANFGFCLEHGLGVDLNLSESARRYEQSMNQHDPTGTVHYTLCLHFGIGFPEDVEMAADYYGFVATEPSSAAENPFRCLRGLNKATLSKPRPEPEPAPILFTLPSSFEIPPLVRSYRVPGIGLRPEDPEIGKG